MPCWAGLRPVIKVVHAATLESGVENWSLALAPEVVHSLKNGIEPSSKRASRTGYAAPQRPTIIVLEVISIRKISVPRKGRLPDPETLSPFTPTTSSFFDAYNRLNLTIGPAYDNVGNQTQQGGYVRTAAAEGMGIAASDSGQRYKLPRLVGIRQETLEEWGRVEVGHRCRFDGGTCPQLLARPNPVIERQRRNRMHNFLNTGSEELSPRVIGERKRTLLSRNLNYLRDMALFWPLGLAAHSCGPDHCGTTLTGRSITMQITTKGQVTIPQEIRNRLAFCRIRKSSLSWPGITPAFARPGARPVKASEGTWPWKSSAAPQTPA